MRGRRLGCEEKMRKETRGTDAANRRRGKGPERNPYLMCRLMAVRVGHEEFKGKGVNIGKQLDTRFRSACNANVKRSLICIIRQAL